MAMPDDVRRRIKKASGKKGMQVYLYLKLMCKTIVTLASMHKDLQISKKTISARMYEITQCPSIIAANHAVQLIPARNTAQQGSAWRLHSPATLPNENTIYEEMKGVKSDANKKGALKRKAKELADNDPAMGFGFTKEETNACLQVPDAPCPR